MNPSRSQEDLVSEFDDDSIINQETTEKTLLGNRRKYGLSPAARKFIRPLVTALLFFILLGWVATSLSNRDPELLRAYETGYKTDLGNSSYPNKPSRSY